MVKVIDIDTPLVRVFSPDKQEFILNEYEFLDLRVQIMKEMAEGWTAICETGVICTINKDGRLDRYPKQFDLMENYLYELVRFK